MASTAFDTLRFARTLRERGEFPAQQAEGLADAVSEAFQTDLASKNDVDLVRGDVRETELRIDGSLRQTELRLDSQLRASELQLEGRIREAELRLEAKVEASKAELVKWMFGTIGFQTLIILGAVVALSRAVTP